MNCCLEEKQDKVDSLFQFSFLIKDLYQPIYLNLNHIFPYFSILLGVVEIILTLSSMLVYSPTSLSCSIPPLHTVQSLR